MTGPEDEGERGWQRVRAFRAMLHQELDLDATTGHGISNLNVSLFMLILLSAFVAALMTEPTLADWLPFLLTCNVLFAVVFTVEYVARVWVKLDNPTYAASRWGPLAYMVRWYALIDLLALCGIWLEVAAGYGLGWVVMLRLARVLRIFALRSDSDAGRAARALRDAVADRWAELTLAALIASLIMMGSAVLIHLVEREAQPEAFGSIPRALYWTAITLTTVGYGDVTPTTALGKFVAMLTAFASIGLIAVPAGIMASAFSDAVQRLRRISTHHDRRERRHQDH